ncbi:MAG TPA: UvrB/UvrC motif-containing protein [Longimicrobiales bacterium]
MLGPEDSVLYVGKSIRIRTRLLSYFRAPRGEKAAEIIANTRRIEWDYTPSEFAALLGELQQIRRWRPLYNVEHKRDRQHCFIKLTREAAPRLLVTGTVSEDGALYYGPFRGQRRVHDAVREIADVLQLRDCTASTPIRFADQIDLFGYQPPPRCIRPELRRCLAPCAAGCTRSSYAEQVELARRFLEGDADRPLQLLRERMHAAAERLQFEYAASLRDRIARLEAVRQELLALRGAIEDLSFLYTVPGHAGDARVYLIRRGTIRDELPLPHSPADHQRLAARARQVFRAPDPSSLAVEPDRVAEILLIARWFRLHPGERARTTPPDAPSITLRTA